MRFAPLNGNTCKSQLYFVKIVVISLLFCEKLSMETQPPSLCWQFKSDPPCLVFHPVLHKAMMLLSVWRAATRLPILTLLCSAVHTTSFTVSCSSQGRVSSLCLVCGPQIDQWHLWWFELRIVANSEERLGGQFVYSCFFILVFFSPTSGPPNTLKEITFEVEHPVLECT